MTANTHMNNGPFLGITYSLTSLVILIFGINYLAKNKDLTTFIIMCLIITSLSYWGFRLYKLFCLGCAVAG